MNRDARLFQVGGLLLVVLLAGGVFGVTFWWHTRTPAPVPRIIYFQDATRSSGVDFTYRNGEEADHCTILESLGGGVALFDFDGDGLLDIFLTGGGTFGGPDHKQIQGCPCKLYKNLGDWKFQDVTDQAGLDQVGFYTHGCAVGDYDCDGWPDLLVTGYGRMALYHNEPVDPDDPKKGRKFVDVTTQSRLPEGLWSTSAAWADLDGDGFPDLYVCNYLDWSWATHKTCMGDKPLVRRDVCAPETFRGAPHRLYRNNRDGTFTDVSREAGLLQGDVESGKGLGVVIVDVNDDRRPDIYAVNDTVRNFLYENRSRPGELRFTERGRLSGVAMGDRGVPDGSMGVDAADYDGCGRPSLLVTTFEGELPALYHNDCANDQILFRYATQQAGLAAMGSSFVGFGAGFLDVDLDGWEDLVTVNGHVRRFPTTCGLRQQSLLLRNQGDGKFVDNSFRGGEYFADLHRGRGLAVGDLDNDGRADLVISHMNEPVVVLRNVLQGDEPPSHHWLGLELLGRKNRDIAGAKVVVEVGKRRLTRFAKGGGSYLSSSDRRLLFGLAAGNSVNAVTVFWPWGEEQHWNGLPVDQYWQLLEGEPEARSPRDRYQTR
jgi:hypothetical protein